MKYIVFTLISLMVSATYAQTAADANKVKVAVIDTGYSGLYGTAFTTASLCKEGHYDLTKNAPIIGYDEIGHGTFVANLIVENAMRPDICIVVFKVDAYVREETRHHIGNALVKAYNAGVRVVNISMAHPNLSQREQNIVNTLVKRGMKIFVSAGNEGVDLNQTCRAFPACYGTKNPNLYRVGATDKAGLVEAYSNRGSIVQVYEYGDIPGVGRGTSFASPRAAARYLREQKK